MAKTKDKLRKTGIDFLGEVPWGTHFCQFYHTKEELIDILVPYFKAGLENNEFCMWITAENLNTQDAAKALGETVEDLDNCIRKGQIEILDFSQWYTRSGRFDSDQVLRGWIEKEQQALERGFDGLRLTGNTYWLEKKDWESFKDYEAVINRVMGNYRMLSICTYYLDICTTSEIIDVLSNHQFAIITRNGNWEVIESNEYMRIIGVLEQSEARYRQVVEDQTELICRWLPDNTLTFVNGAYCRHFDKEPQELVGHKFMPLIPKEDHERVEKHFASLSHENPVATHEHRVITPDGEIRWQQWTNRAIFDEKGNVVEYQSVGHDITDRKKVERQLQDTHKQLRLLASELSLAEERLRRRLATNIHDMISQNLAALKLNLSSLRASVSSLKVTKQLDEAIDLLGQTVESTRSLTVELSPPVLYELGLEAAVKWLLRRMKRLHGTLGKLKRVGKIQSLGRDVSIFVFQSIRELLFNVVKHAKAQHVTVTMRMSGKQLEVTVEDDGIGFNPTEVDSQGREKSSFGLFSLRERLSHVGGHFEVSSTPNQGTKVTLVLPTEPG